MNCVYFIKEKIKEFTPKKDKLNILYIGETKDFEIRKISYTQLTYANELYSKLLSYAFVKLNRDVDVNSLVKNIQFKIITSKYFKDDNYRKEVEGYFINRFNPLLNKTKRDAKFTRSYLKFKSTKIVYDANSYKAYIKDIECLFNDWYDNRNDIGDTDYVVDPRSRKPVERYSSRGREIVMRNREKKYSTWFHQTNKLNLKYDSWRTNYKKWFNDLKWR